MKTILAILLSLSAAWASEPYKVLTNDGTKEWSGTAFYISETHLLTAAHVIKHRPNAFINKDGQLLRVRVIKIDFEADIALLECDVKCANPYALVANGKVTAIGFAKGQHKVTTGVVTQIEASSVLVDGMSGCPVVNSSGDVIGMGVRGDGGKHPCYAVPSDTLLKFIEAAK